MTTMMTTGRTMTTVLQSYAYLTAEQNQRMSLLKARAKARAEYKKQGICTDLFYDAIN
jgi:hypothetical protein